MPARLRSPTARRLAAPSTAAPGLPGTVVLSTVLVVTGLLVTVLLVTGLSVTAPGAVAAAADAPSGRLALTSQTSWVAPGSPFDLQVSVTSALPPSQLELEVSVYGRSTSRSTLDKSLTGHFAGPPLRSLPPAALSSLPAGPGGSYGISVPTSGLPGCGAAACPGVYPVAVELRDAATGSVLDRITTPLVATSQSQNGLKLHLAWVLALGAPPLVGSSGQHQIASAVSQQLAATVSAIEANLSVPVTLELNPETLQALASSGRPRDLQTLSELGRLAAQGAHPVLGGTYVPVDLAALAGAGLGGEISAQRARGQQILSTTVGGHPTPTLWPVQGSLSAAALSQLDGMGVTELIVPEADLAAYSTGITLTQAFQLQGPNGYQPTAVSADPGLASFFVNGGDPVLQAHQLLGDLAAIYFDRPGSTRQRAVVAEAPPSWVTDPVFTETLLSSLATSPLIDPVTADQLFALGTEQGAPALNRRLGTGAGETAPLPAATIRNARSRLDAFASAVTADNPVSVSLDDLILLSEGSDLRPAAQARFLTRFGKELGAQLSQLSMTSDRSITLTARTGQIPITIISRAPYEFHAVLSLASDKLSFPRGAAVPLVLAPRDNAEYVDVESRGSGAFPLTVSLVSPDGNLIMLQARYTVRSTAASGVAILLSVGAGLILLSWWLKTAVRGRRQRHLLRSVPRT